MFNFVYFFDHKGPNNYHQPTEECGRERDKRTLLVLRHDMTINISPMGPPVKTNNTDMEQNSLEKVGDIKVLLLKQLRTLATNV